MLSNKKAALVFVLLSNTNRKVGPSITNTMVLKAMYFIV